MIPPVDAQENDVMRKPNSMKGLEDLGRVRLSQNFFLRDFLHSEIADFYRIPNIPEDPDLAIETGKRLCEELLEPLEATFGRLHIRSGYRSPAVNRFGNENKLNCSTNASTAAHHIWDMRDFDGCMGAAVCIAVPWMIDHYHDESDWQRLAWWIHDHLPYASLCFFPKLWAFNIQWHERPKRVIQSYVSPRGILTKPGMANWEGDHAAFYEGFPPLRN
ncbi:hypothetical protein ELI02_22115 [Rhizobium leguminosarum]|uniref:hypothetical protein n=1 Tax=Rhizobium TaxID=379 RepID=UPI0010307592|nr:hypothetical protein [Rhizobium leguminosarum]TAV51284.1 hypothetical protein ELI32_25265 [Rhizobium leguminosarum]TAV60644.1 hypothetical protein ELI31_23800 [Rhizobium leguminosarum]TAV71691.1 hypothetical protein ELI30_24565 [Rhizobium leguminosarum]TAX58198.1 hypothetical protein ELI01_24555 [Rhizobium leguminosarum]TAX62539.1 hypothetical protein ELI02_22115 [Rhizobium leguminosarum]